ncbi:MAG: CopG family transcriptional regulator [Chloroflexota bacterium]
MKRFQILLEDELDEAIQREAHRRGTSKADVLRSLARDALVPLPPLSSDPIYRMAGRDHYEPVDIDEVVYG